MGLLDKLKKTFFEEELVEVEEEKVAKKVESKPEKKKEIKKEAKKDEVATHADEIKARTKLNDEDIETLEEIADMLEEDEDQDKEMTISDRNLVNKSSKIEFFNDADFVDEKVEVKTKAKEEPKKIYGGEYTNVYDIKEDKKVYNKPYGADNNKGFHPTPIISPIYGVLDKNYRKEEVRDKKDRPSSYVSRKDADYDTVMEKAYGDRNYYEEDIPSYDDIIKNANVEDEVEAKEPLLYDMMVDDSKPVVDQVSIQDAEDYFNDLGLEYNVDYKDKVYEKASGRRVENHNYDDEDIDNKTEEIIINKNLVKDEKEKELEEVAKEVEDDDESKLLEDNLFDLVDSMYEGGEE